MNRFALLLMLIVGLSACSGLGTAPGGEPGAATGPSNTLLSQANAKAAAGDTQAAIAVLERAVRLQPRDAHAWLRLAELYLEQGEYHKAEQFAGRAHQFAGGDRALQKRANQVIERARSAQRQKG